MSSLATTASEYKVIRPLFGIDVKKNNTFRVKPFNDV